MNAHKLTVLATIAVATSCLAQSSNLVLSFSQLEHTLSGSGGTVLRYLYRNEMAYLNFGSCASLSSEKWLPRTCSHVMAGDENGDGQYWNPGIFGDIDAVLTHRHSASPSDPDNQRTVFWSVSSAMGDVIAGYRFRPGDVARIVSDGSSDGRVEVFMSQDLFNISLGRSPNHPLDIDAIAWQPNLGIWFSIDNSMINANTMCGPMGVRDGDVICIPPSAIAYTADGRIASVMPSSAIVVYTEAEMDAFTANANVADHVANPVTSVSDVEGLEMDLSLPITTVITCMGMPLDVPVLLFTTETATGASILTTQGTGQIHTTPCGLAGTPYHPSGGNTTGEQMGLMPPPISGVFSHITGLGFAHARTYTLETDTPVVPMASTASPINISYNTPFPINVMFLQLVPSDVPRALVALPFSLTCFPDWYAPAFMSVGVYMGPGFGVLPSPPIPTFYSGKILFQSAAPDVGNAIEFSTPLVVDWR